MAIAATLTSVGVPASAATCDSNLAPGMTCIMEPWETVGLEHRDRINRLLRLADGISFTFHEELVSAEEHGLTDFPTDIPVLRVVASQDVFFDSGSDTIRREALPLLDVIAGSLKLEPPDVSLLIAGHTDWVGDEQYNYELGLRRAQSVAAALVRRGIYQAQIYRLSYGELLPIATNETAAGRARNRRVEFLFSANIAAATAALVRLEVKACAEQFSDEMGDCRIRIELPPIDRISVSPENQSMVTQLEKQFEVVDADPYLSEVQAERMKQEIEAQRMRIPIVVQPVRIPVSAGSQ